jgi:hypothetical protein
VITLQQNFFLTQNENNAYNFYQRLLAKEKIEKNGASYFKSTFQFLYNKNKMLNFLKSGNEDPTQKKELKSNLDKFLYKRIKENKKFKKDFQ